VRPALSDRTVFLDENGREISFLPGKTFIHVVHWDQPVIIGNDPSVGDVLVGAAAPTPRPIQTPRPTREPQPTREPRHTRAPRGS